MPAVLSFVAISNSLEAYVEITMLTRLCNILLRRPYLQE